MRVYHGAGHGQFTPGELLAHARLAGTATMRLAIVEPPRERILTRLAP